jgi:flavodoxin
MKAVIVYASTHHGNTQALVQAICQHFGSESIDAAAVQQADLSSYELIGFASGIDFGRFYAPVEEFLIANLPPGKRVFFLYTCARLSDKFTDSMRQAAQQKQAQVLGEFGCRGYNTYGPLKLIGGINKGHPDAADIEAALAFYASLTAAPQ